MNYIILGNIICLAASAIMVGIGFLKKKNNILIAQCFQCGFFGLGQFVLGGYSGAASNVVTILRNLYSFKFTFNLPAKIVFIILQAGLGLYVNNLGVIGLLPIVACILFTWFLDTKSDKLMKTIVIITTVMWTIYDFTIKNYTSVCFDISAIATNCVGMYRILQDKTEGNDVK